MALGHPAPLPQKPATAAKSPLLLQAKKNPAASGSGVFGLNPDDDLLSHSLGCTTIGAATFHFRVRDGIGWFHSANFIRETVGVSPSKQRIRRLSRMDLVT